MLAVGPLGPQYWWLFAWYELGRQPCWGVDTLPTQRVPQKCHYFPPPEKNTIKSWSFRNCCHSAAYGWKTQETTSWPASCSYSICSTYSGLSPLLTPLKTSLQVHWRSGSPFLAASCGLQQNCLILTGYFLWDIRNFAT